MMTNLTEADPQLAELIQKEQERQRCQLQMIPSENYVSRAVLQAVGSVLMNKYSEGQTGKRYYQGNKYIDQIESLVKKRALQVFGLDPGEWRVNVQPANGSVANLAVYAALLEPGERMLSMFLYDGGHLSHGWKLPDEGKAVSFSAKIYEPHYYYVDPRQRVFDYDQVEKRAGQVKPKIIISGGTAYPREVNHKRMGEIARAVGAYYLADIAHEAGLVLAGVNKSPFEHADVVTMTTRKTLRGPIGAMIFSRQDLSEQIDKALFPGLQGGPQNHSIAGIGAALFEASQPEFKEYARRVVENAQELAQELLKFGCDVVSGGTDKHLILVDLRNKGVGGKEAARALEEANIIVNKNTVPGETAKPWAPSGIRLGTPALTSRGMGKEDMVKIAGWIDRVLSERGDWEDRGEEGLIGQIAQEVSNFAVQFPVPGVNDKD